MSKKLTKHGNSLALVIDKGILDLLNIDERTELEMTTDGDVLVIKPERDQKRRKQFEAALEKTIIQHGRVFKRLAER